MASYSGASGSSYLGLAYPSKTDASYTGSTVVAIFTTTRADRTFSGSAEGAFSIPLSDASYPNRLGTGETFTEEIVPLDQQTIPITGSKTDKDRGGQAYPLGDLTSTGVVLPGEFTSVRVYPITTEKEVIEDVKYVGTLDLFPALSAVPENNDPPSVRIQLLRVQYSRFFAIVGGENTPVDVLWVSSQNTPPIGPTNDIVPIEFEPEGIPGGGLSVSPGVEVGGVNAGSLSKFTGVEKPPAQDFRTEQDAPFDADTDFKANSKAEGITINSDNFEGQQYEKIVASESFEDEADGDPPPEPFTVAGSGAVDTQRAYDGFKSFNGQGTNGNNECLVWSYDGALTEVQYIYNEKSNEAGHTFQLLNANGNEIAASGSQNPEVVIKNGNGTTTLQGNPDPKYNEWRRFTFTLDYANNEVDIAWDDLTGNNTNYVVANEPMVNDSDQIGQARIGSQLTSFGGTDGIRGTVWFDNITSKQVNDRATLALNKRSFDIPSKPGVIIEGDLNGGEVVVEMRASPKSPRTEVVTKTLQTTGRRSLPWDNFHRDFEMTLTTIGAEGRDAPVIDVASIDDNL